MKNIADLAKPKPLAERTGVSQAIFEQEIRPLGHPVVLRGLAHSWPAVSAAQQSSRDLASYLMQFDAGKEAQTFLAKPEVAGRYFYRGDMRGFNFERRNIAIAKIIEKLLEIASDGDPMGIYAGAGSSADLFPGFGSANKMALLDENVPPLIWIGNAARIAPHFDTSENIAVAVNGERRFTIFPPDQVSNLYIGPLDFTMAGQPASMVDPVAPDLNKFPNFREAMNYALVADLEPGDAIYLPALWWHHVQSFGAFNVLVNYWWGGGENGSGLEALAHGLLSLRDRPAQEKKAWLALFQHYVFSEEASDSIGYLPDHAHGVLGKTSPERNQRIISFLLAGLNRD
ncbi:MAG: cupin-like domain-containing protein [Parasphingorhabdus sp.]|uniref:cupin-like domain-containing protein n=1 Tax=Parasphingorhabdus sp. TaxID=2709688 RepID=UPI0032976007